MLKLIAICIVFLMTLNLQAQQYAASFVQPRRTENLDRRLQQKTIEVQVVLDRPVEEAFAQVTITSFAADAKPGQHYNIITRNTVIIPNGEFIGVAVIQLIGGGDTANKGFKSFGLSITGGSARNTPIVPGVIPGLHFRIKYPDVKLTIDNPTLNFDPEGDKGEVTSNTFNMYLDDAMEADVVIDILPVGGNLDASEYNLLHKFKVIEAGEVTQRFKVEVYGDDEPEEMESALFEVSAWYWRDGVKVPVEVNNKTLEVTVEDDDKTSLYIENQEFSESEGVVTIPIQMEAPLEEDIEVTLSLVGGGAQMGKDYIADTEYKIAMKKGEFASQFQIEILDDRVIENTEEIVFLCEVNSKKIEVTNTNPTITIIDNDSMNFYFSSKMEIIDPDSGFRFLNLQQNLNIKRNGPYRYRSETTEAQVIAQPDPLGLTGAVTMKVTDLEFNRKWEVTKLEVEFSNFPAPRFPIPGPHLYWQMFTGLHGPSGDGLRNEGNGVYTWIPQLGDLKVIRNTDKDVTVKLEKTLSQAPLYEEIEVTIQIRK